MANKISNIFNSLKFLKLKAKSCRLIGKTELINFLLVAFEC